MRIAHGASVIAAILVAAPAPASARPATHGPSGAQIRAAVARAERSRGLWATINICDSKREPNRLGIRGQMPTLGFTAALAMDIQVDYWSTTRKRFLPDAGVSRIVALGNIGSGLRQGGASFPFDPHAGRLSGTVTFQWKLRGRPLGHLTRTTTAGHPAADHGSPPQFSASTCTIT